MTLPAMTVEHAAAEQRRILAPDGGHERSILHRLPRPIRVVPRPLECRHCGGFRRGIALESSIRHTAMAFACDRARVRRSTIQSQRKGAPRKAVRRAVARPRAAEESQQQEVVAPSS